MSNQTLDNVKPELSDFEKDGIITIIVIIFTFGSLGNIAICFVYRKAQLLQKLPNCLIVNLAICDLLLCMTTGFMIHGLKSGTGGPSKLLCDISGYLRFVFTFVSFAAVTLIMVKRYSYVMLCDNGICQKVGLAIAIQWLYHILLGLGPLFGWSQFTFSQGKLACTCRIKTSLSFSIVVAITSMLGPLVVLVFCSVRIFEKLKQLRNFDTRESSDQSQRKREEIRGTIILFSVTINYFICAAPFITVNLLEIIIKDFVIPLRLDIATAIITQLMPAINPVIFGFGNARFRRACCKLLKRKRKRTIKPVERIKNLSDSVQVK